MNTLTCLLLIFKWLVFYLRTARGLKTERIWLCSMTNHANPEIKKILKIPVRAKTKRLKSWMINLYISFVFPLRLADLKINEGLLE